MAVTPSTTATNAPHAPYDAVTPQKVVTAGTAILAFNLHQIFRRAAYRHSCDHLPPSYERLACVSLAGRALGMEGGFVALVAAVVVYLLINRINQRTERPHEQ